MLVGSILTGVIGVFVVVACAATLHGHPIDDGWRQAKAFRVSYVAVTAIAACVAALAWLSL